MNRKTTLASTMLIAAVPAAVLGIFLVISFLTSLQQLTAMKMVLSLYLATLVACVAVVFLPFGILIFGGKAAPALPETEPSDDSASRVAKEPKVEPTDEFGSSEMDMDELGESPPTSGDLEIVDVEPSSGDLHVADEPLEEVEDDAFFFDDEVPPKKPKK